MADRRLDEEEIFHVARKIPDPEARAKYLDQICSGDQHLSERVGALLKAHEQEQAFLHSARVDPPPTAEPMPTIERPGITIGRYRLMEQIGEGGMGVVFVAEQEKPIRRKVALKVIKPGMDSKSVIARFESERQALAMMDHGNIAKVLDAGTTDTGRPYFVMELVHGVPITDYCDRNKLPIHDRLELFTQVCQAIQHAHQKGIIHRDIKPTNVLVTLYDGKPVPKVIDFGVAKALHQRLTERTIYTSFAQVVGTPLYMSPEQAELSGLDIDTRSDVYSLGVLLYELLTGTTPFDKRQFDKAAYDEIRRIIRETDPPKPSTKIGSLGETATSVSLLRGTDQRTLSRLVTGDLDIIAMKALEKDRTRRYDTASGLAADVERFLKDEPIVARSPSIAYRFAKFARRNRTAVVTSAVVLVSLVLGIVATTWSAHRANQTLALLAEASYEQAVSAAITNDQEKAQAALKVARSAGVSQSHLLVLDGLLALNRGDYDDALDDADRALREESPAARSKDIGAHALRAVAAVWAGYDDVWFGEQSMLRQLSAQSDTEHLLKAYAIAQFDPSEAKGVLAQRGGIERSPAGMYIRAITKYTQGIDRQDAKLLDEAIGDFRYVEFLFHDAPSSMGWHLTTLAAALELARAEKRQEDIARYSNEGWPLAEKLATRIEFPSGSYSRWQFYKAARNEDEAWRAIRGVGQHPGTYSWYLAADCLRRYSGDAAVEEFDKAIAAQNSQSPYVRLARAHVVRDCAGGAQQVRDSVEDLLEDPSPLICHGALVALCLVCKPSEIQGLATRATRAIHAESLGANSLFGTGGVAYLVGQLDEQEFLRKTSEHISSKAIAHFTIAMMRLAAGKRTDAHEQLRMCVATNAVGSFYYEWGRAYLRAWMLIRLGQAGFETASANRFQSGRIISRR